MKQTDSESPEYGLKLNDGGVLARRKTENSSDGLHFFEDEFEVKDFLTANVITCQGWLLEFVQLKSGEMFFQKNEETIRPTSNKFCIFYPPFTFTRPCFQNAKGKLIGVAGIKNLQTKFTSPVVFEIDRFEKPENLEELAAILDSVQHFQIIEANPKASLISIKAKKLIDENYQIYPSIAKIAGHLQISHEHLTRQFKTDFGMSPNKYLHQLRIADATFRLSQGEQIIRVSNDVGYNDLSRFYKQFRQSTTKSPKYCQAKLMGMT